MKKFAEKYVKKLIWIPGINVFVLFICYYNRICDGFSIKRLAIDLWIVFSTVLPLELPLLFLSEQSLVSEILQVMNPYIVPLILSYRFIQQSEKV